ncbi:hypothetical protein ATANTOWER_010853 [Ataeniobius toweri]|uniref:Uncharacterized protein n=1 Tax=Ataeniobius toweri TaxID=208326 RepID=A0ABU7AFT6_9TELE|nr:hypothetical protein [Ataeniobius toweri]
MYNHYNRIYSPTLKINGKRVLIRLSIKLLVGTIVQLFYDRKTKYFQQSLGKRWGTSWTIRKSQGNTETHRKNTHTNTNTQRPIYLTVMVCGLWEEAGVP